jgi:hypothetical protein
VSQNLKVIGHRFVCPECGGNTWGSSYAGSMVGRIHCHGYRPIDSENAAACSFSAPYAERFKHFVFEVQGTTRVGFEMLYKEMERSAAAAIRAQYAVHPCDSSGAPYLSSTQVAIPNRCTNAR